MGMAVPSLRKTPQDIGSASTHPLPLPGPHKIVRKPLGDLVWLSCDLPGTCNLTTLVSEALAGVASRGEKCMHRAAPSHFSSGCEMGGATTGFGRGYSLRRALELVANTVSCESEFHSLIMHCVKKCFLWVRKYCCVELWAHPDWGWLFFADVFYNMSLTQ